jgi:hypothetical protein
MPDRQPDLDSDIIVQHVRDIDASGQGTRDRWLVYVGRTRRSDTEDPQGALVFARLLADLNQRPVWVLHGPDGPLEPLDPGTVRGCSCC